MNNNQKNIENQISNLIKIINNGNLVHALKLAEKLSKVYKNIPIIFNLYGIIQYKLNNFEESVENFNKAIQLNPNFFEAYNNLGNSLMEFGKFKDAINKYESAIKLKPEYASAYNNLGGAWEDLGDFEKAIFNYSKAIKFNPEFYTAKENILNVLTFHKPKNSYSNIFVELNSLLQNVKIPYDDQEEISEESVISYYKKCDEILSNNIKNFNLNLSQIWRKNTYDLNCIRHYKVFYGYKVIPKFCFGCFKVQIDVSNILDLFRIYFIFDNVNLNNNNLRKCMIELRPIIGGSYKGLIYCRGQNDAKDAYNKLKNIIEKKIKKKIQIKIKRGCSEFGMEHPNYKILDEKSKNYMNYKNEWKEKENIIDEQMPKINRQNQKIRISTLHGNTLNDFLIMKNWIMYARKIGDINYKKFDKNLQLSNYMEFQFSKQLEHRVKEFSKMKT